MRDAEAGKRSSANRCEGPGACTICAAQVLDPEDEELVWKEMRSHLSRRRDVWNRALDPNAGSSRRDGIANQALRRQTLPIFGFRRFADEVGREWRWGREKEEEERREKERKEMWTTPGQRPVAEPPVMDWDHIFLRVLQSDKQYAALFPADPGKVARQKDLDFEAKALDEHIGWAEALRDDPGTEDARRAFYSELCRDLQEAYAEVSREAEAHYELAADLGKFEFRFLDREGGTEGIEAWLGRGARLWGEGRFGAEVARKYAPLVPEGFAENGLATFEAAHLDAGGRVGRLRRKIMQGWDVFVGESREVVEKYGGLIPPDFEVRRFQRMYGDEDGGLSRLRLEKAVERGVDVLFRWGEQVKEKYGYLIPPDFVRDNLATFEFQWLDPQQGTAIIERELKRANAEVLAAWGTEVQQKYGHLIPPDFQAHLFRLLVLDPDGGTQKMQMAVQRGIDVFVPWGPQVREEYGYLVPPDFAMNKLLTFEHHALDKDGGTTLLQRFLDEGNDVLTAWGPEVQRKYWDLIPLDFALRRFKRLFLDEDGGTTRMERDIKRGVDVLGPWGAQVREAYGYLMPADFEDDDVATFEHRYLDMDGGTSLLETEMKRGNDVIRGWGREVENKYAHLRALLPPADEEQPGHSSSTESEGSSQKDDESDDEDVDDALD